MRCSEMRCTSFYRSALDRFSLPWRREAKKSLIPRLLARTQPLSSNHRKRRASSETDLCSKGLPQCLSLTNSAAACRRLWPLPFTPWHTRNLPISCFATGSPPIPRSGQADGSQRRGRLVRSDVATAIKFCKRASATSRRALYRLALERLKCPLALKDKRGNLVIKPCF